MITNSKKSNNQEMDLAFIKQKIDPQGEIDFEYIDRIKE